MTVYADSNRLDALWKEVYAPEIDKLIPDGAMYLKEVKFEEASKLGDKYIEPVILAYSQGLTYLGTNSSVATLNAAKAGIYGEAQVDGYGLLNRDIISYSAASKMQSSKASFMKWGNLIVSNLMDSLAKRLEIGFLWGQYTGGLGVLSATSDTGSGTYDLTISAETWCPGLWSGMEGAVLDVLASGLATETSANADVVIASINFATRTLSVTCSDSDTFSATDVLFFKGACTASGTPTWSEQVGLAKQFSNTSAAIYNINAGTYSLWQGNTLAAGSAAFTMGKALTAVSKAVARGLKDDVDLLVSAATFNNLNADQGALRSYDNSYRPSKAESGTNNIVYYGPNGRIEVKPHLYMKDGMAMVVPRKRLKRIGSSDVTFNMPGTEDKIFLHVPDKSGLEIRNWTEQTMYCNAPCWGTLVTGIVNS